jgi:hypothetical protein
MARAGHRRGNAGDGRASPGIWSVFRQRPTSAAKLARCPGTVVRPGARDLDVDAGQAGQGRAGSSAASWNHAVERFMPFQSRRPGSCRPGRLARWHLRWERCRHALMVDMPVIVRHQDRGALRLDHRHDQALCRRRLGDLVFDHRHNAADRKLLQVCALNAAGSGLIPLLDRKCPQDWLTPGS